MFDDLSQVKRRYEELAYRMTPAKLLGCVLGFAGVLIGTLGNHDAGV